MGIGSFQNIFDTFLENKTAVSMDTSHGYYIGWAAKVSKKSIHLSYFDNEGTICKPVKIRFKDIKVIYFGNRYTETFSKYIDLPDNMNVHNYKE